MAKGGVRKEDVKLHFQGEGIRRRRSIFSNIFKTSKQFVLPSTGLLKLNVH